MLQWVVADIIVSKKEVEGGWEFAVEVNEKGSKTDHTVTMSKDYFEPLNTSKSPEEVVKLSFEFLLSKEPKEMILSEFDIIVISKYFPEFSGHMRTVLK